MRLIYDDEVKAFLATVSLDGEIVVGRIEHRETGYALVVTSQRMFAVESDEDLHPFVDSMVEVTIATGETTVLTAAQGNNDTTDEPSKRVLESGCTSASLARFDILRD